MKSKLEYIKELSSQAYCPMPYGILFCPRLKLLGPTRIKYFIDRFIRAFERSKLESPYAFTFECFETGEYYKTYHSKTFKKKIIREGVRLGLLKNLLKVNENCWYCEFNLAYVFRKDHHKWEIDKINSNKSQ